MRLLIFAVTAVSLSACCCQSREEKLKSSEDEGNFLIAAKARMLKGAGEAVKKEGKEAAETIAEGTGEVVKGLGKGIQKGLMEVKVNPHETMAANGLGITRAARGEQGTAQHTITVYVTFEKGFEGILEMRAYDSENREVGRSKLESMEKDSGAKYIDFVFDERTPLMTASRFDLRATRKTP